MAEIGKNKVLIAGGIGGEDFTKSGFILDLTKKKEASVPVEDLRKERRKPSCIRFQNKLYLIANEENNLGETEIFDIDGKSWTQGPSFPKRIDDHATLAKVQNQLFCSDSENLYKLNHRGNDKKWELVQSVKGQKSKKNSIPLTVITVEYKYNDDNMCTFSNL